MFTHKLGNRTHLTEKQPFCFLLREITDWAVGERMFQVNLAGIESLRFTSLSNDKAVILEKINDSLQD